MVRDGEMVKADFIPRPEHSGFTHAVHGGLITTALDELMAWAIIVTTRKPAYSAELTVRFQRPLKVGEKAIVSGWVTANRKLRLFETSGELRNAQNELCATATGKYLPLNAADTQMALQDFPEELRGYFMERI